MVYIPLKKTNICIYIYIYTYIYIYICVCIYYNIYLHIYCIVLGTHHSLRTFWRFWRGMNLSHPCQRDLRMSNCAAEVKYGDQKSPWNLLCFFPHDYIWLYMRIMIYSAMCVSVSASLSLPLPSAKQMYFRLPGWSGRGCLDKSAFPLVGKQLVTINLFFWHNRSSPF